MAFEGDESIHSLLQTIQQSIPEEFPKNAWYLIVGTILASIGRGDKFGDLYKFVTEQSNTSDLESRKRVSKRFREVIIKSWTLIGMPRAISASYSLQAVDKCGDDATDQHRQALAAEPDAVLKQSQDWFGQVFGKDESKIFARFSSHQDMEWALRYVVYGLFLSDLGIVTPIENECIVLASVLPSGGSPVLTHMTLLRRLGLNRANADFFHEISVKVSRWAGADTTSWPTFESVEHLV